MYAIICGHSKDLKLFHFEPTVQNYGPLFRDEDPEFFSTDPTPDPIEMKKNYIYILGK